MNFFEFKFSLFTDVKLFLFNFNIFTKLKQLTYFTDLKVRIRFTLSVFVLIRDLMQYYMVIIVTHYFIDIVHIIYRASLYGKYHMVP